MRLFTYGDRLRFPATLFAPRNFGNPEAFDYREYPAEHGITVLASTKAENIEILPGFVGNRAELWRSRVHRSIIEKVHQLWPNEAGLMDAMVIGEDAFINRATRIDFQRSGTYHVLVVSGMNVTGDILDSATIAAGRISRQRRHDAVDGFIRRSDECWSSHLAGHTDADCVSICAMAVSRKIDAECDRGGSLGLDGSRSAGAFRRQF